MDRWIHPEYVLQLPQESLKGALGIGFETKVSNPSAVKPMPGMAVSRTAKEKGQAVYIQVKRPSEKWEERFVQFPASLDPGKVKTLRIGLNSRIDDITFELRDIRIVYAR